MSTGRAPPLYFRPNTFEPPLCAYHCIQGHYTQDHHHPGHLCDGPSTQSRYLAAPIKWGRYWAIEEIQETELWGITLLALQQTRIAPAFKGRFAVQLRTARPRKSWEYRSHRSQLIDVGGSLTVASPCGLGTNIVSPGARQRSKRQSNLSLMREIGASSKLRSMIND